MGYRDRADLERDLWQFQEAAVERSFQSRWERDAEAGEGQVAQRACEQKRGGV